jgi:hypothetical protein
MLANTLDRFTSTAKAPSRGDGGDTACFDLEYQLEKLSPAGTWVRVVTSSPCAYDTPERDGTEAPRALGCAGANHPRGEDEASVAAASARGRQHDVRRAAGVRGRWR